jgi:hypothetical protein
MTIQRLTTPGAVGRDAGRFRLLALLVLAVVVVGLLWAFAPQIFRVHGVQTPVSVTVRESLVGAGLVVRVRNESDGVLENVVVTARDKTTNRQAEHAVARLKAGETAEVGWLQWGWKLKPDHTVTVDADGHLPIVFTAGQIGVH